VPKRIFDRLTLVGRARLDVTITTGPGRPLRGTYDAPGNMKYAPGSGTKPSVAASGVKGKGLPDFSACS
jgi:hypothetical protein